MIAKQTQEAQEVLSLIGDLAKSLRFWQREDVFCGEVTFAQFFVLDAVASHGPIKLGRLHDMLGVEKSTTTRLLKPLLEKGFVKRAGTREDGRIFILTLTKKGKGIYQSHMELLTEMIDRFAKGVPEEARRHVYENVRLFAAALQNCCGSGTICG